MEFLTVVQLEQKSAEELQQLQWETDNELQPLLIYKQLVHDLREAKEVSGRAPAAPVAEWGPEVMELVMEHAVAKVAKNVERLAEIKSQLAAAGLLLEDTEDGKTKMKAAKPLTQTLVFGKIPMPGGKQ